MKPDQRQPRRLPAGGLIDRGRPVAFRFNGRECQGHRGDTLASALLANGLQRVARSYKLHRPRGIFSAGEEEPCALVEVRTAGSWTPNCRATLVHLFEGLDARSQLGWPSVDFDLGRWVDLSHPLWPAGFYNKTFKWPRWRTWEPWLRRMAGLGRAPLQAGPERYEQVHAHCDVLVCGAGPAGLAAALAAASAGLQVMLVEQDPRPGGTLLGEHSCLDDMPGAEWAMHIAAMLHAQHGVRILTGTTLAAVHDGPVVTLAQASADGTRHDCLWIVRPRRILLAGGATEQGLLFPGNDRPGIMLASAARTYLNRYAVAGGTTPAVACNNDAAWQTAFDFIQAGWAVAFIADARPQVDPELERRARAAGIEVLCDSRIARTLGAAGLRAVELARNDGRKLGQRRCDLLAVSGGWAPRVHAWCHARGSLRFDQTLQCFLPAGELPELAMAGSAAGVVGLAETLADGTRVGVALALQLGKVAPATRQPLVAREPLVARRIPATDVRAGKRRQWIDLMHDVTLDDAALAVREGFTEVEHFKRFTTTGMAADQGKTGNLNAFLALGSLTGRLPQEVGTTTFRPPYTPVSLGAVAGPVHGEGYVPRRYLPAHRLHHAWGAVMADYSWQRPDYYPQRGETPAESVCREVLCVRHAVGVFDNSPIGKIEVHGPDAARFLDRIYVNDVIGIAPGRARYGLMLNENGVLIDDGICTRLGQEHFLLNTSSAHVALISNWLERWAQCEWPELDLVIDDVTNQWACYTVAGPQARQLLHSLRPSFGIAANELPHMAWTSGRLADLPARIARVSFSGELSFEVSVPAGHGVELLSAIAGHGAVLGLEPYGIEALMLLRLEKGYLHVGTDTDGATSSDDVGWGAVARRKSGDFIGRRSLERPANRANGRRQLVGVEPVAPQQQLRIGGHFSAGKGHGTQGWITSAGFSPSLQRWIGLGVLSDGRARTGQTVGVYDHGHSYQVRVTSPCFYDPEGHRLHV